MKSSQMQMLPRLNPWELFSESSWQILPKHTYLAKEHPFAKGLSQATLCINLHTEFLTNFSQAYHIFETFLREYTGNNPLICLFKDEALYRSAGIAKDLEQYKGEASIHEASTTYALFLDDLNRQAPSDERDMALFAYAFVRLGADLAGGSKIKEQVQALIEGAWGGKGSAHFYFEDYTHPRKILGVLKDMQFQTTEERDIFIAAAKLAFQYNTAIYDAIMGIDSEQSS